MLPPGIFLLLILSSSSSWSSLHFPLKLELAIYREKMGDTIKAGSIYQSRSDRLHYVLFPSSAALKQEGRESPRRNPALPAHQRPTGGGKSSGGVEEGGKTVGMCERERESAKSKRVSGFPWLRMHVHICKSSCSVYLHTCAGSWVLAAQGFDVLMRHGAHCRRGS